MGLTTRMAWLTGGAWLALAACGTETTKAPAPEKQAKPDQRYIPGYLATISGANKKPKPEFVETLTRQWAPSREAVDAFGSLPPTQFQGDGKRLVGTCEFRRSTAQDAQGTVLEHHLSIDCTDTTPSKTFYFLCRPTKTPWIPILTNGDAGDLYKRITGKQHPQLTGDLSAEYRAFMSGDNGHTSSRPSQPTPK